LQGGWRDVWIMKTTDSAFVGYPKCEFTTLPETNDRILATLMQVQWTYQNRAVDFPALQPRILPILLDTFAATFSPSVQNTLYLMGQAVLEHIPELKSIELSMPNKHYLPINLNPFQLENRNEIFLPTDEPHGQIEALITRT
jgi:urate oxidase